MGEVNLSDLQKRQKRVNLEENELEIAKAKQDIESYEKDLNENMPNKKLEVEIHKFKKQIEAWEEDLKNDVPNKKTRLEIRKLNNRIDILEQNNRVFKKQLRTGTEMTEEVDLEKFEQEKAKEK